MLPKEFESTAKDLVSRYKSYLEEKNTPNCNLLEVEEKAVSFAVNLGLEIVKTYAEVQLEHAKNNKKLCLCGRPLNIHRVTKWIRQTPLGRIEIRDPYLYCPKCKTSHRPLHALLGTDREMWSLVVEEAAVDLVTDEPCGRAVAKLARHHPGVEMERTSALRMLHKHGKEARTFINQKLAEASKNSELPPKQQNPKDLADELEVQFDGGMIPVATLEPIGIDDNEEPELTPVRGLPKRKKVCRWEEVKLGLVQKPDEISRLYSVQPTAGLSKSFDDLFALACIKGWSEETKVRGISDGARHIRPRLEEAFTGSEFCFILDRPHCKQHLTKAGEVLEAITKEPAQQWADNAMDKLEAGDVWAVINELQQTWEAQKGKKKDKYDALRKEAAYFKRNQDAVAYSEYRKKGWSSASSEVESGHRHVVQVRVKISGAWWHPDHVDDILALRMLKANEWWDEYWATCRQKWNKRAEAFASRCCTKKTA